MKTGIISVPHIPALLVAICFGAANAAEETPTPDDHSGTPTNMTWSLQRFRTEFCGEDSWEPFNRSMYGVFDFCMDYGVDPFCYVYSSIVPKPLITGIDNACENLEEPVRIFSSMFMGEWSMSWDATRRFFINSTIGIGGLFDPAEDWMYIMDSGSSLSDTFVHWGIPAGPQLALPFVPRSSVRGHAGYLCDYAFDLKTWIDIFVPSRTFMGYTWMLTPNDAPIWSGGWDNLTGHTADGYYVYMPVVAAMNDFNLRQYGWHCYDGQCNRARLRLQAKELPEGSPERVEMERQAETFVNDVRPSVHESAKRPDWIRGEWREIPGYSPRGACLDSLRALCFSPVGDDDFWWERHSIFNRDFSKSIMERELVISNGLPKATYSFVSRTLPEDGPIPPEKLVIVLPGIGAGRTASEVAAMAELLHSHGYSVVMCDSVFHFEHMRSVNRGILPGNLTEDMRRYADYLAMVIDDLCEAELICNPEISVMGWSMGGLTTAHFAAMDDAGTLPFHVSHFVAINPPVSVEHSLRNFTPFIESSREWPREKAKKMFTEIAASLYGWASMDHPRYNPDDRPLDEIGDPWNYAPNLTEEQANYLLGQTMRIICPPLVAERHKIAPFPWIKSELTWFNRRKFYEEVGDISFEDYVRKYLPTCYDGVSVDSMLAVADIHSLESALAHNTKLTVIHTWNDPLEDDEDRKYFDRVFGKRITWFADGGHCGYFYTKPFEVELLRRLSE